MKSLTETPPHAPIMRANYFCAIKRILISRHLNAKDKSKFLLRTPRHWRQVAHFLHDMKAQGLDFILEKHPRLLGKFSRPYLSVETNAQQTLDKLLAHYRLLGQRMTKGALEKLYQTGLPLCRFSLDGEDFECILKYDGRFEKEGEICISLLQSADRRRVYTLIAVFGAEAAFIGCLQGGKEQEDVVRRLTKLTNGLRPHNLVVFVTQEVARALGCQALYGVPSASHVYQARSRTSARIGFGYDRFWEELGGERAGAWYALPITYPRNPLEEVPSKKRMLYRRRYALMDTLAEEIAANMAAIDTSPSGR